MSATQAIARSITAPAELGLDTRVSFREAAARELEGLPVGGTLAIDLAGTKRVDSAGLSTLMLLARQAAERSQTIVLRDPSDEIRFLLALTRLTDLFQLTPQNS